MRTLVIGYGSAGRRHASYLSELGVNVSLLSAQSVQQYPCFLTLEEAMEKHEFEHVIVANSTHLHEPTLKELLRLQYKGSILVEKPLVSNLTDLPAIFTSKIKVAYNLRFHRLLLALKDILKTETMISFSAHVGQYLPSWRPDRDYRESYSAKKSDGGGVLRDLSHELDYCLWLCGHWKTMSALGGQYSDLEISSDDVYTILMRCEACPVVTLQLNYLNRIPKRDILIQTNKSTIVVDFQKGTLSINGEVRQTVSNEMEKTYRKQLVAFINGDAEAFTSYQQGLDVVALITAAEQANYKQTWIEA